MRIKNNHGKSTSGSGSKKRNIDSQKELRIRRGKQSDETNRCHS
jgi:hypothetical protein